MINQQVLNWSDVLNVALIEPGIFPPILGKEPAGMQGLLITEEYYSPAIGEYSPTGSFSDLWKNL